MTIIQEDVDGHPPAGRVHNLFENIHICEDVHHDGDDLQGEHGACQRATLSATRENRPFLHNSSLLVITLPLHTFYMWFLNADQFKPSKHRTNKIYSQ